MATISEPTIIERGPYLVVGAYVTFEGTDEGPGWSGASQAFLARAKEIVNRVDDKALGFLYRPHRDHDGVPKHVRACFVGVEVTDLDHAPEGMNTTTFSGGKYAIVACTGDTQDEAAMAVGEGVHSLETWITKQGYTEGDACFACSVDGAGGPPFVEYVYMSFLEAT